MIDLHEFLGKLKQVKEIVAGKWQAICPAHDDTNRSLSVSMGDKGILIHCHAGCKPEAIAASMGIEMHDLFYDDGQDKGQSSVTKSKTRKMVKVYQYTDAEGNVLHETCRYEPKTFRQRRPNGKGGYFYNLNGIETVLYRLPKITKAIAQGEPILLCEGEKDVEALECLGYTATTSPMGAGKWHESYSETLKGATVYIFPDNDKAGYDHAEMMAAALIGKAKAVKICSLTDFEPGLVEKADISDLILRSNDAPEIVRELMQRAREAQIKGEDQKTYVFETIDAYLEDGFIVEIKKNKVAQEVKSGFKRLDDELGGRINAGLYVIGSGTSMGKTSFCGQLADNIAAQSVDVIFFSLEMAKFEMTARNIMRELFKGNSAKFNNINVGHLLNGKIQLDQETADVFTNYAKSIGRHLSIIEGNFSVGADEIAETAKRHIAATGRKPVIFVDYLQVLKSPDVHLSDKQAMDYNVVQLKRISRDLDIAIFLISSLNRTSYNDTINFASFKESGAIEYTADFMMGLQAASVEEIANANDEEKKAQRAIAKTIRENKNKIPRELEAVIIKNRRGKAQGKMPLTYYPAHNYFVEGKG